MSPTATPAADAFIGAARAFVAGLTATSAAGLDAVAAGHLPSASTATAAVDRDLLAVRAALVPLVADGERSAVVAFEDHFYLAFAALVPGYDALVAVVDAHASEPD